MYADDNDGWYPIPSNDYAAFWIYRLRDAGLVKTYLSGTEAAPYVKGAYPQGIWRCPSEMRGTRLDAYDDANYGMSLWLKLRTSGAGFLKVSRMTNSAITFLVGDTFGAYINWSGGPSGMVTRHNEGANFVFFDGHVEWLTLDQPTQDMFLPW